MTRRNLLFGILTGLPLLATEFTTINAPENLTKAYNRFAMDVNEWLQMRHDTPAGAYSWPAKRQWDKKVKPEFHELDVVLKNE